MLVQRLAIIGSRETPKPIQYAGYLFGKLCVMKNVITTSGHANGMDYAGEQGARENCVVYLPWADYNSNLPMLGKPVVIGDDNKRLDELVDRYHPAPQRLKRGARSLMRRNGAQVLGENLDEPVDAVVCWTNPKKGGTTQAVRIAEGYGISVLNLWDWTEKQLGGVDSAEKIWTTIEELVAHKRKLLEPTEQTGG